MGHTVSCPLLPQYAGQGKHHHPPPQTRASSARCSRSISARPRAPRLMRMPPSSSAFALVYDNVDAAKKMEPKYRQIRSGFQEANSLKVGRKQRKEKKNREKKFRGTRKEKRVRPGKD